MSVGAMQLARHSRAPILPVTTPGRPILCGNPHQARDCLPEGPGTDPHRRIHSAIGNHASASQVNQQPSQIQLRTPNPQPVLAIAVVRQHLVHLVPERIGVIAMMQMAQFMDHDVVDDGQRRH
jgi:hypothetical protein